MKEYKTLVSVCCITYNHAKYIKECLGGFLMQKTNFKFEILVHDDASTDGTKEIIEEYTAKYPDLFFPVYQKENQYSKGVRGMMARFNFPRARGKYIALCEGDDYWTDPLKLQKQVDFLEENEEYVFCYHRFMTKQEVSGIFNKDGNGDYFIKEKKGIDFNYEIFYKGWHIGTQTLMFRSEFISKLSFSNPFFRDVFMIADLLQYGKGYCLNDFMAVYRKHDGGVYSGKGELKRSEQGMQVYRAIHQTYPNEELLKLKYKKFALSYIKTLNTNNKKIKAFLLALSFLFKDRYYQLFRDSIYILRKY
jgi:glycosyltransferase involved in cell wall biosynthesis